MGKWRRREKEKFNAYHDMKRVPQTRTEINLSTPSHKVYHPNVRVVIKWKYFKNIFFGKCRRGEKEKFNAYCNIKRELQIRTEILKLLFWRLTVDGRLPGLPSPNFDESQQKVDRRFKLPTFRRPSAVSPIERSQGRQKVGRLNYV